jgi:hypothetical protein
VTKRKPKKTRAKPNEEQPLRMLRARLYEARRCSVEEFSQLINVAPDTVHSVESGRLELSKTVLDKIEFYCGASWDAQEGAWKLAYPLPGDKTVRYSPAIFSAYRKLFESYPADRPFHEWVLKMHLALLLAYVPAAHWYEIYHFIYNRLVETWDAVGVDKIDGLKELLEQSRLGYYVWFDRETGLIKEFALGHFGDLEPDRDAFASRLREWESKAASRPGVFEGKGSKM